MKRSRFPLLKGALVVLLLINLFVACDFNISKDPKITAQLKQEGATLNLYWPANGTIATWISNTLVPDFKLFVKNTYGVDMNVNVKDTNVGEGGDREFFKELTAYEQKNSRGGNKFGIDLARIVPSLDLLDASKKGWLLPLLPDSASRLPNAVNINSPGLRIFTTSAGKTYAMPVYQPTISFFYNKEKVPNPPRSLRELLKWVKENPRRFTYEDPTISSATGFGSGIVFLLMVMRAFGNPDDPGTYNNGFAFLRQLRPYIYPPPTGPNDMLNLMKHHDIWLMPYWNNDGLVEAQQQHLSFMINYFPQEGTPVRNTPLIIPHSAQHQLAALLFMNFAISDAAQLKMAGQIRQFPASSSKALWQKLPTDTFGSTNINIDYITNHTYAAFNSEANLRGINIMADQYPRQVSAQQ